MEFTLDSGCFSDLDCDLSDVCYIGTHVALSYRTLGMSLPLFCVFHNAQAPAIDAMSIMCYSASLLLFVCCSRVSV
jgi:hypothetical protein